MSESTKATIEILEHYHHTGGFYEIPVEIINTVEEELEEQDKEIERLNKELEIYKLRHKLALKKLNSAIRHYDNDKENNAIIYTKQILEGQGIEEKCLNMLREK